MKRVYIIIVNILFSLATIAQTIGDAFYIYRNDGQFNAFFRDEVDSITYSRFGVDSLLYDETVTQVIYTQDSIYQIPLAAIDSVGFVQPETIYRPGVMRMNETWLPYIVNATETTITFRRNTPIDFLPNIGQVMVTDIFEEPFETGFSGRVCSKEQKPDGIVFEVENIGLQDIYEHLVAIGISSSYNENSSISSSRKHIWGMNQNGKRFPLSNIDIEIGPATISCVPEVFMKYIICVGEQNLKDYVDLRIYQNYEGSVQFDCKIDKDYKPDPKWNRNFIPIPTGITGVYGKIQFGGFIHASGEVQLSAEQPFNIQGVSGFVKAEGQPHKSINVWNANMDDTEFSININGSIHAGLAAQLQFGVIHEKIASADITAYVGPKISGNIGLTFEGVIDKTLYSSLKDSKIQLSLDAEIVPGYRFWGGEHSTPVTINLSHPLNSWYIVPLFSNLNYYKYEETSIVLTGMVERDLLSKVSLGWGIYDMNDDLYKSVYFPTAYRKNTDWIQEHYGLEFLIDNLPVGNYKAYPLIRLIGEEIRADEYVDLDLDICPDENHPHLIDLGLPSGTKWACCNIGAPSPSDGGGLYAWGETEEKTDYSLSNYAFAQASEDGRIWIEGQKWNFTYIGENICGTKYDVANTKWGNTWRMPSNAEMQELISQCTWRLDKNCYIVTGPNGASISLPITIRQGAIPAVKPYWTGNLNHEASFWANIFRPIPYTLFFYPPQIDSATLSSNGLQVSTGAEWGCHVRAVSNSNTAMTKAINSQPTIPLITSENNPNKDIIFVESEDVNNLQNGVKAYTKFVRISK